MIFNIRIQKPDGKFYSWSEEPNVWSLIRALEKCEIKSFEISQNPIQQ